MLLVIARIPATKLNLLLLLVLLPLGYFVFFETRSGHTPGKKYWDLIVVTQDDLPLTLKDALLRNLLRIVDWLPACYLIGTLFLLATGPERRLRLGDRLARTKVVPMYPLVNPRSHDNFVLVCASFAAIVSMAAFILLSR